MQNKILEVKNLNKYYVNSHGINHAVNNVSFSVKKGEVVGLIGQSGSGKTTVGRALMRTLTETNGTISLNGKIYPNFSKSNRKSLPYKKKIQMIYQNPMDSLNGLRNIYSTLKEALDVHDIFKENIKMIIESKKELKATYEYDFKLLEARVDNDYYKKKEALISNYILGFQEAINKKTVDTYLFSEGEKLNKDIIKLLIHTEESFSNAYNHYFKKYHSNKSGNPIEKALIKAQLELNEFDKNRDFLLDFNNIVQNLRQKTIKEIKSREIYIKENIKSFIKNQHKMQKSFKEVSNNHKDLLISTNYKISEMISSKIKTIYKDILKELEYKTISPEKLNNLMEFLSKDFPIIAQDLISDFRKSPEMIRKPRETLKSIKWELDSYEFNFDLYLENGDYYKKLMDIEFRKEMKILNSRKAKFSRGANFAKRRRLLVKNFSKAKKNFTVYKKAHIAAIQEKIDILQNENDVMIKKNEELSKMIHENTKKAISIFKNTTNEKINFMKEKSRTADFNEKKETLNKISLLKKQTKSKLSKYKIKNDAYSIEKTIIANNINKIKMLCGLKKEPILFSKTEYTETIISKKIYEILKKVGLKPEHAYRYPHEFSGGQLQRILIARALLVEPEIIVADEPIASLDISIQAQVINLLIDLVKKNNISLIFIGHDLSTIEYLCDKLLVMHLGRVVEKGSSKDIFNNPIHPYTKILFKSIPKISEANKPFELFKGINEYLGVWSEADRPSYHNVSKSHIVLANNNQWKEWNVSKKSKKA